MPESDLEPIWTPTYLERLARTYWRYLSRVTLGLIRVVYTPDGAHGGADRPPDRAAPLPRAGVRDGRGPRRRALADPRRPPRRVGGPRGRRLPGDRRAPPPAGRARHRPRINVEVEIASFYPAIALRIARWFYANTQSRIHVLVTHGFLRSLAKLELEESAVGRFAVPGTGARGRAVRDRSWPVVGALAGIAAALLALVLRRRA